MNNPLYTAIFRVASVLEIPVVVAALLALAFVIVELGRFGVESNVRLRRRPGPVRAAQLTAAARAARAAVADDAGRPAAARALLGVAWNARMEQAFADIVGHLHEQNEDNAVAKVLADFDLGCQRRLARTRLLVRVGPALGLMGTLIPLAPALQGLAKGDTKTLTDNLQVAFSITVLGLLIGAVAFGLSLVRETMYGQDYSDLEYVASVLTAAQPDIPEPEPPAADPKVGGST